MMFIDWLRKKTWRRWVAAFFLFISLLIASLTLLVSTNAGSRLVLNLVSKSVGLQLGEMKGNLLTGFDIAQVKKLGDKKTLGFTANDVSFRWQPLSLFYTALNVQSLKVAQLALALPEPPNEKVEWSAGDWPSLAQPLRVELHHLDIQKIVLQQSAGASQEFSNLKGSLSLGTFHLRLSPLQVNWQEQSLKVTGAVALRYPYAGKLAVMLEPLSANSPNTTFSAKGELTGDIKTAQLTATVALPVQASMHATINPALQTQKQKPHADIKLNLPHQEIPSNWLKALENTEWNFPKKAQADIHAEGWLPHYTLDSTAVGVAEKAKVKIEMRVQGYTAPDLKKHEWDIQKAQWQFFSGDATQEQPAGMFSANGKLVLDAMKFSSALALNLQNINAAVFRSDIQSEISGRLHSAVEWNLADSMLASLKFNDVDVKGSWQSVVLNLSGNATYNHQTWFLNPLQLRVGDNQLQAKGSLGQASQVEWNLSAPKLNQLLPELGGKLTTQGSLTGDFKLPRISAQGEISQFVYKNIGMDKASWTVKTAENNFDVNFLASHWQWQDSRLAKLVVTGKGQLDNQQWQLLADSSSLGTLQANWQASLISNNVNQTRWQGNWQSLELRPKHMPAWHLLSKQPFQLEQLKNPAEKTSRWQWGLGPLCLTTGTQKPQRLSNALGELPQSSVANLIKNTNPFLSQIEADAQPRLCIEAQQNTKALTAHLDGDSIPLSQWQAWLKNDVILSGLLMAKVDVSVPMSAVGLFAQDASITAKIQTKQAQLVYQFQGGETEMYPLKQGHLSLDMKGLQGKLDSELDWGEFGRLAGALQWTGKDKKLNGQVSANVKDLAPLEALLPFLNDVKGEATAQLDVAGNLARPQMTGRVELINGRANIPKLGLELKEASLLMTSQLDGNMQVDAQVTSGDGTLMLRGDLAHLGQPDWEWKSNIFGANIRAVDQPELIANVSPNFKIHANAQQINLTGSTEIPWARSQLKTLPETAIRVSQDVTVVESKSLIKDSGRAQAWPFLCNFLIYFGDDVRFTGFGLDSLLSGKINVLREPNRQTLTTGFVAVGQGKYKAYGQELNIERGRLIFQGPYDDPGLDIRAVRVMENASAGLDIGGTLQRPKSKVFSIPATSDSDAMALLLTGKTLSQSSQSDAYSILGAIGSLGMDRGSSMTADITRFFRLDELTVKSNKGLEQSALWMGKQITPKLFIRYMVGLFDQAFTLGMRYQISDKLRLEVESGKANSVDVIYTIER